MKFNLYLNEGCGEYCRDLVIKTYDLLRNNLKMVSRSRKGSKSNDTSDVFIDHFDNGSSVKIFKEKINFYHAVFEIHYVMSSL